MPTWVVAVVFIATWVGTVLLWVSLSRDTRVLRVLLNEQRDSLLLADELAGYCMVLPAHRSSDSFTGTTPNRVEEVGRNQALEMAADMARRYLVSVGKARPRLNIPDTAFRAIGGLSEELKGWQPGD